MAGEKYLLASSKDGTVEYLFEGQGVDSDGDARFLVHKKMNKEDRGVEFAGYMTPDGCMTLLPSGKNLHTCKGENGILALSEAIAFLPGHVQRVFDSGEVYKSDEPEGMGIAMIGPDGEVRTLGGDLPEGLEDMFASIFRPRGARGRSEPSGRYPKKKLVDLPAQDIAKVYNELPDGNQLALGFLMVTLLQDKRFTTPEAIHDVFKRHEAKEIDDNTLCDMIIAPIQNIQRAEEVSEETLEAYSTLEDIVLRNIGG